MSSRAQRTFCSCAIICALLASALAAAEPEPGSLQFRRIYAPADRIKDWPFDGRYLPIDAKEFQRLVERAQAVQVDAPQNRTTKIDRADYTARWTDDGVLVGQATFEVSHASGDPSSLLPLDPCNLAISNANWRTGKTGKALVGHGPDGKLGVLVERSGRLVLDWSLRGDGLSSGAALFRFLLPRAPISQLRVDLPKNHLATTDAGLTVRSSAAEAGLNRWAIELGGRRHLNLRVLSEEAARQRRQLTLLRQALTYEFSPRGIDVSAQLRLDVHSEPLQTVRLEVDQPLRLVSARYGEVDIPWSARESGSVSTITLEFPEPLSGVGRVIRLAAVAPLTLRTSHRLPGIRAPSLMWQEGSATLLVPSPLVLEKLETRECRQSRTAALPAPLAGDSLEVQYYAPTASVEVVVTRPLDQLEVDSAIRVELGPTEATAENVVRLASAQGERFVIEANLQPHWQISSIEADAADMIASWEVAAGASGKRTLSVRLTKAVSPSRQVALYVVGRRPCKPTEKLAAGDLAMLTVANSRYTRETVGLSAAEGYELATSGDDELNRLDWWGGSTRSTLVAPKEPSLRFIVDQSAAALQLWLERTRPNYTADIQVDVAVQAKTISESYLIRCIPGARQVERLQVHFTRPQERPLQWTLAGGSTGRLTARKLEPAPTTDKPSADKSTTQKPAAETWEISLRSPRTTPFEIRGNREMAIKGKHHVALASLPLAASQSGSVTVRALGRTEVEIDHAQLRPMTPELLESGYYQTVRGSYRYDPARQTGDSATAITVQMKTPEQFSTGAWAWTSRLKSRFGQNQRSVHQCMYWIETGGQERLKVSMPSAAEVRSISIDGGRLPIAITDRDRSTLVNLPSGRSSAVVVVEFSTDESLPYYTGVAEAPWPTVDIPVVDRHWSVWVPSGFALSDLDSRLMQVPAPSGSWSERWFGPFGRSGGGPAFNPLRTSSWKSLAGADSNARDELTTLVKVMQTQLGATAQRKAPLVKWSEVLGAWGRDDSSRQLPKLLMDHIALDQVGIRPESPVEDVGSHDPLRILDLAHLTLLVHPQGFVITTGAAAAAFREQLTSLDESAMTVNPGPLSAALTEAFVHEGATSLMPANQWLHERTPPPAWLAAIEAPAEHMDGTAWSAYEIDVREAGTPRVRIVSKPAWWTAACATFLVGLGIALWLRAQRVSVWLAICCTMAAALLLIPPSISALGSALFLAVLVALVARTLSRSSSRAPTPKLARFEGSSNRLAYAATATAVAIAVAAILWRTAGAAEPFNRNPVARTSVPGSAAQNPEAFLEAQPSAVPESATETAAAKPDATPSAALHRVFVPVNSKMEIDGDQYYVPEALYNELYRRDALAGKPPGWLVTRAIYRGTLTRESADKKVVLSELKAIYDFQTFHQNTRVQIPLSRKGVVVPAHGIKLEGQVVRVDWDPAGDSFTVGAAEPGIYRLEIGLEPSARSSPGSLGFDLDIPAVAASVCELTVPADGPSVELPTATGRILYDKQQGKIIGELGVSPRLAVRWHEGTQIAESALGMEVEELIWLKVQPGSFLLDTKIKARATEGRVRRLRLLVDPRLRLLPPASTDPTIAAIRTAGADPHILELQLHPTTSEQVVVNLSFLMSGTSGVGKIRPPRLETLEARLLKRWVAVSVDSSLEFVDQASQGMQPIAIPDFAAAWQSSEARPHVVYSLPRGEVAWTLSTQAPGPRTTAQHTLTLSAGSQWLDVRVDTDLTTESGSHFQLRLAAPPALEIESISLLEDGAQRVSRWSRDEAGRVTIFLTAPITGVERLSLRGRLAVPASGAAAVPDLRLLGAVREEKRIRIFRRPAVLVEGPTGPTVSPIELPIDERERTELGSFFGAYRVAGHEAPIALKISPNRPQSQAVQLISLERKDDGWMAEVDCQVSVTRGLLDSLRFDLPTYWVEPFESDGQTVLQTTYLPDRNRRQLIVRPTAPIKDRYRIKIRGRVLVATGERLRVPDVALRGMNRLERFVVLPTQVELQEVAWDISGLKSAKLPSEFVRLPVSPESFVAYKVDNGQFQAALRSADSVEDIKKVSLADIAVSWTVDGRCSGVAAFDLIPGGSETCDLRIPGGCKLLHLSIAGLPAIVRSRQADVWTLELVSRDLPQRIIAVFSGAIAEGGWAARQVQIRVPTPVEWNITRTLWTVVGPPAASQGQLVGLGESTRSQQQLLRLQSTAEALDVANQISRDTLPNEITRWRRPWIRHYQTLREQIRQREAGAAGDVSIAEQLEPLDRAVLAGAAPAPLPNPTMTPPVSENTESFAMVHRSFGIGPQATYGMTTGKAGSIEVRYPHLPSSDFAQRLVAAIGLVGFAGAGGLALRDRRLPQISVRAAAIGIGLVWWLLLEPSVVGLCLAIAGLLSLLWTRRSTAPASTIRRLPV